MVKKALQSTECEAKVDPGIETGGMVSVGRGIGGAAPGDDEDGEDKAEASRQLSIEEGGGGRERMLREETGGSCVVFCTHLWG